jgi:hydrogenase maturation protease
LSRESHIRDQQRAGGIPRIPALSEKDLVVLVAGIGNIFLGDDGFGSEAARRIAGRISSPDIRVVDFGIRGLDFAYALMDGYETTIMIDAVQRGREPGTIYVIAPDLEAVNDAAPCIDAHTMDPMSVLLSRDPWVLSYGTSYW